MTVVVGFVGNDGAVMASDSEGVEADETRRDVDKIWCDGGICFGYTGTSVVAQPLRIALKQVADGLPAGPGRWDVRAALCAGARPVLETAYANFVPGVPSPNVPPPLAGSLMAIGRDDEGFWLLEIDQHNGGSWYDQDPGFHAIGSGSVAAQMASGLLAHYRPLGRTLPQLRLIAYRAVATCISVLGGRHGVGGEVRIWEARRDGSFARVGDAEMTRIENGLAQWTTIESETLDQVVLEEAEPPGADMPVALEDGDEQVDEGRAEDHAEEE